MLGPVFAEDRAHDVKNERGWGGRAFYNIYETADGHYITLSGNEPKFVASLLGALQRTDLTDVALSPPGPQQEPLIRFFADTFASKSLAQWLDCFDGLDLCYGPVLDVKQAFEDPQADHRQMLLRDEAGNKHVGAPIKFEREPARPRFDAPALNEHAGEVLRGAGYTDEEIAALHDDGVLRG